LTENGIFFGIADLCKIFLSPMVGKYVSKLKFSKNQNHKILCEYVTQNLHAD